MQYVLVFPSNPNRLNIQVDKEVAKSYLKICADQNYFDEEPSPFSKDVLAIKGVVSIIFRKHCITIKKGHAFDWADIVKKVLFYLEMHYCITEPFIQKEDPVDWYGYFSKTKKKEPPPTSKQAEKPPRHKELP